jgi:flavin-binding protein dodecin
MMEWKRQVAPKPSSFSSSRPTGSLGSSNAPPSGCGHPTGSTSSAVSGGSTQKRNCGSHRRSHHPFISVTFVFPFPLPLCRRLIWFFSIADNDRVCSGIFCTYYVRAQPYASQPIRPKRIESKPSAVGTANVIRAIEAGVLKQSSGKTNSTIRVRSKENPNGAKGYYVVGTSKESFAKAAENAVAEAAKTVRGMKWARVAELEMELDGKKIIQYRTTAKIYFDIEH